MAQSNQMLYIAGGVAVAWWLGLFDELFAPAAVAVAESSVDNATNIVTNPAPTTAAGQQSVAQSTGGTRSTATSSSRSDSSTGRSAIRDRTGGSGSSSSSAGSGTTPASSGPVLDASGCYTAPSPFGPRRICP